MNNKIRDGYEKNFYKNHKGEKGSIIVFVLVSMLFILSIVVISYTTIKNKQLAQLKQINKIESSYVTDENSKDKMEEAYQQINKIYTVSLNNNISKHQVTFVALEQTENISVDMSNPHHEGLIVSIQMVENGENAVEPNILKYHKTLIDGTMPLANIEFEKWDKSFKNIESDLIVYATYAESAVTGGGTPTTFIPDTPEIPGKLTESQTEIYVQYNKGIYLDKSCTLEMTLTQNNISLPSKTEYTFKGYYTEEDGNGIQIIDENGYITNNFDVNNFKKDTTLYAYWTTNYYTIILDRKAFGLDISKWTQEIPSYSIVVNQTDVNTTNIKIPIEQIVYLDGTAAGTGKFVGYENSETEEEYKAGQTIAVSEIIKNCTSKKIELIPILTEISVSGG